MFFKEDEDEKKVEKLEEANKKGEEPEPELGYVFPRNDKKLNSMGERKISLSRAGKGQKKVVGRDGAMSFFGFGGDESASESEFSENRKKSRGWLGQLWGVTFSDSNKLRIPYKEEL